MAKVVYRVSVKIDDEDGVFKGHWLKWRNHDAQGNFIGDYFKTPEKAKQSVLRGANQYGSEIRAYMIEKLTIEEVERHVRNENGVFEEEE